MFLEGEQYYIVIKNTFVETKKFSETDINEVLEPSCYIWWTYFSADSRHSYGHQLLSSSRRHVFLIPMKPITYRGFSINRKRS